jgi:predicted dehydrogenase
MSGGSCHLGAGGNRHQLEFRAIGSEGQLMIDLERDEFWLYRVDGTEFRPTLEPDALLYDCDGPPNTLVDLALGRDVINCSPGELGARAVEIVDAAYRSARSGQLEAVRT